MHDLLGSATVLSRPCDSNVRRVYINPDFTKAQANEACKRRCKKLSGRLPQYAPPLQVDLLTLKVMSESRVTWATSVPILVFLGLYVLELGPMYATGVRRQTDRRQTKTSMLNASALWGRKHNNK